MWIVLHIKEPPFLSYLSGNLIFSTYFRKIFRCKFSTGSQVVHLHGHTHRQMDRRTWRSSQLLFAILWTHLKNPSSLTRCNRMLYSKEFGSHGGAVGWGTAVKATSSRVQIQLVTFGIFRWRKPSCCTVSLWVTSPITGYQVTGGRCLSLTTLPRSCADCLLIR